MGALFHKTKAQYPWELWVNDTRYAEPDEGFARPPSNQVILLHPNAGYEFGGEGEERLRPALILEILGYNWWRWDESGEMRRPFGASAVVSVADRVGYKRWSVGGAVHILNRYTVGATWMRGEDGGGVAFFANLDVAEVFRRSSSKLRAISEALPVR